MLVSELREQQTSETENPDGIPLGIVALLEPMYIHIPKREREADAERSPALPLRRTLPKTQLRIVC